jgi:hypothetical protein
VLSNLIVILLTTMLQRKTPMTKKPIAFEIVIRMDGIDSTPETIPPDTESTRRLRISSIIAAPIIAFAALVCNLPISFNTFAVIAMLVAVRAVPTNM